MARDYKHWSDEEDDALRAGFALGETVPVLMARVPGRTKSSVYKRLFNLGLYRRPFHLERKEPRLGTFGEVVGSSRA